MVDKAGGRPLDDPEAFVLAAGPAASTTMRSRYENQLENR